MRLSWCVSTSFCTVTAFTGTPAAAYAWRNFTKYFAYGA